MNEIEELRKNKYIGFAEVYLQRYNRKLTPDHKIDIQMYSELVQLDSKLGTSVTDQLFKCLSYSLRLELIKV